MACTADGQFVGANYGSSSILTVSYDASESSGSRTSLQHTTDRFFQGSSGKAYSFPAGPAAEPSKIIFTPTAGYEVSFRSFDWDKLTATTSGSFFFEVRDASNALLFSANNSVLSYSPNTAYSTGPLTFLFGNGGVGSVAVDNVTVDVRAVAAGAVPEPASWAMMLFGFGALGTVLRRNRRQGVTTLFA